MTSGKRLFLIGTVHRDPRGEERLGDLLAGLKPTALTLEMSPTAADYRRRRGRLLLQRLERILDRLAREEGYPRQTLADHPAVADIRRLLSFPFEYRASHKYADQAGIPFDLIDLPEVSVRKLRLVESDLITYRNLRTLLRLEADGAGREEDYGLARTLILGRAIPEVVDSFLQRRRGEEGIGRRDALMAEKIRSRLETDSPTRLAHVGGWVHMLDDRQGETLYSQLRDLEPERILLG
jgi:hypothetical protein